MRADSIFVYLALMLSMVSLPGGGYARRARILDLRLNVDERQIVYTVDRHVGGLYTLEMDF
jgi:hypothetical protein